MENAAAHGHDHHKNRVFMEERKRQLSPVKAIVHLIKQSFATAPVIIKQYNI